MNVINMLTKKDRNLVLVSYFVLFCYIMITIGLVWLLSYINITNLLQVILMLIIAEWNYELSIIFIGFIKDMVIYQQNQNSHVLILHTEGTEKRKYSFLKRILITIICLIPPLDIILDIGYFYFILKGPKKTNYKLLSWCVVGMYIKIVMVIIASLVLYKIAIFVLNFN